MKISDYIADFLAEKNIKHVFGIIGAGNAHIFDSIYKKGFTEIVCVHHEQAACMAMQTYYRTSGKVTAVILTTGAGSTNGVTGVVSAWADSIPGIIISGNENSKFVSLHKDLRMWGVQGYDSSLMVEKVTKYATRVERPEDIKQELEKAYAITTDGRPGPCWIDVPMNIQSTVIDDSKLLPFKGLDKPTPTKNTGFEDIVSVLAEKIKEAKRPLFWLGHGIKLAGGQGLIVNLIEKYNVPALVTWAGIDMVDSYHPLVYGRAGTYGQRCANFIVQNCDLLICIGTRMAISQIGYEINELAREADIVVVDIDQHELAKYTDRYKYTIHADAKVFIQSLLKHAPTTPEYTHDEWISLCDSFREKYPWFNESDHPDKDGFINSYKFMDKLNDHLKPDQIITTDMGTALLSGHQTLKIRAGQRLMTSTGLGEMGYGLPAAIGASVARGKGEVLCLNCDGGMMMNLQELQTIVHYKLPIKLFIFNNDGYLMIKHTQTALFNGRRAGVDEKSGVSCPDFSALADAFKIPSFRIRTWEDFDTMIPEIQAAESPVICEVFMHPYQLFVPKLSLAIQKDGTLISPPLEDLSPFLPREELRSNMLNGLHQKSKDIEA
ncbi:MAG: acetolactate synthase isozyme 1 large subunit-like [Mucilaginibacter sp.]|uniref:thiamine pyrophosphate-binding protein n=1 Tax=Mucilaginibacter sp. TaxID=1882438 RepID=UPI00260DC002|nr:thiamine pyrophosphate-binding protein [Mucilaginibacter sp.]MDB5002300.1 acetolactate synthase isozyme 1 large subunit-like [Mucilaginibacter sp.]